MSAAEALRTIKTRLEAAGIESAQAEAYVLLGHLLGASRSELLLSRQTLSAQQRETLEAWLARRERREPLQHVLGVAYFYGLELRVTPDVLIPRPETERLVEWALGFLEPFAAPKVLDVGTGSGAVALAVKAERPAAEVLATDVSAAALAVARENAARLGLDVRFAQADLLEGAEVQAFARRADLVVSNPPYLPAADIDAVSPEVRADPALALFSGEDGLAHFRRLERGAFVLLQPDAGLFVELDPRNVFAARAASGAWARKEVLPDLADRPRFLRLVR